MTAVDRGLYLGTFADEQGIERQVRYAGEKHLITIGPNGSGKGTGLIMPNLSDLPRSILIIDPKGEAASITARKRATLGRVVILNPFGVLAADLPHLKSDGFNPLPSLATTTDFFPDDATGMAEALIKVEGTEPHWAASAQELLAALIMWECMQAQEKNLTPTLGHVRKLLGEPHAKDSKGVPTGLMLTAYDMLASGYAPLEAKAGRFTQDTREIQSIISTAATQTRFLDSPAITNDLARGDFDFADMKREIVTVYLILPANRLDTHSGWLRLMIVSALRRLLETPPSVKLPPVLFILDEFAQLGYLPPIENAMGIARGFGVQLWPILQDLNQLHALYKDRWQTFVGARGALTAFAPQDWFTAEYLSKLCGQKTDMVETMNESLTGDRSRGWSQQGFPLFRPEELMGIGGNRALCFVDPVARPFFSKTPRYPETSFNAGLDPNPYYHGRA
jgi:type IV secretion system protein VirD4